jgi:hypothetical protein
VQCTSSLDVSRPSPLPSSLAPPVGSFAELEEHATTRSGNESETAKRDRIVMRTSVANIMPSTIARRRSLYSHFFGVFAIVAAHSCATRVADVCMAGHRPLASRSSFARAFKA